MDARNSRVSPRSGHPMEPGGSPSFSFFPLHNPKAPPEGTRRRRRRRRGRRKRKKKQKHKKKKNMLASKKKVLRDVVDSRMHGLVWSGPVLFGLVCSGLIFLTNLNWSCGANQKSSFSRQLKALHFFVCYLEALLTRESTIPFFGLTVTNMSC